MENNKEIIFTSLKEFQQYYAGEKTDPINKEKNQYYQIGIEAAKLASENTLKTLNLHNK